MAEYDNNNKIAIWIAADKKTGEKYLSISGNVDGVEITGAAWKRQIPEGSRQPQYSGVIGVKTDTPKAADGDIPF
jgi:hypothetical protein